MKTAQPFRTAAEQLAIRGLRAIAEKGTDADTRALAAMVLVSMEDEIASRQSKATAHGLDTDNAAPF